MLKQLPGPARRLINDLLRYNVGVYLVGGYVRDTLMKRTPKDIDLAVTVTPDVLVHLLTDVIPGYVILPTGIEYGTVSVRELGDTEFFEVTSLRKDGTYGDGRRPDNVCFTENILEDLARRDFTMNAIAYDCATEVLIDPHGGQQDISAKRVRCVGEPVQRFSEDALRMLRAARQATQLGFVLDPEIHRCLIVQGRRWTQDLLNNVSAERIREELTKILVSNRAAYGLQLLADLGLLFHILPEIQHVAWMGTQGSPWHAYDLWEHTLHTVATVPADPFLRWAALFHDTGKVVVQTIPDEQSAARHYYGHEEVSAEITHKRLKALKCSTLMIKEVTELVAGHMIHLSAVHDDRAFRRTLRRYGYSRLRQLLHLRASDRLATGTCTLDEVIRERDVMMARLERLEAEPQTVIHACQLAINGHDLIERFQLQPGPTIKMLKNAMLDAVVENPEFNTPMALYAIAEALLAETPVEAV